MKAWSLKHRGYEGLITLVDPEADLISGEVAGLRDVVHFQGRSPAEVQAAFCDSVDDYLSWCEGQGVTPERPFSGTLSLRLPPELHRRLALDAQSQGRSLNAHLVACLSQVGGG